MNSVDDYSGHLVELRKQITAAEEAAARGMFNTAIFHTNSASDRLAKIIVSLRALAEKSPPEAA